MPLLTIIIPVFNAEATLQRTLDSLDIIDTEDRSLTEIILINDGSIDNSQKILDDFHQKAQFDLFVIQQENKGTSEARNKGLKPSKGEWILFLDADDELMMNPIKFIKKNPELTSIGFAIQYIKNSKPKGRVKPAKVTPKNFLNIFTSKNPFQPSSLLFKKNQIDKLFDSNFITLEDWLFWIENPRIFEKLRVYPQVISAKIHIHGLNKTSNRIQHGFCRTEAAKHLSHTLQNRLSKKQRNNLLIQREIGHIQQDLCPKLSMFIAFPCNTILYFKAIIYLLFQPLQNRIGKYVVRN